MSRLRMFAAVLALLVPVSAPAAPAEVKSAVERPMTVYVIRHLQKAAGEDPPLTAEGTAEARRLAWLLERSGIRAIYATPTRRAMETAAPLAERLGLAVTPYDPDAPAALVQAARSVGGNVLVVGHSNTVGSLVENFGGTSPPVLTDEDYGTLFVVQADGDVSQVAVR